MTALLWWAAGILLWTLAAFAVAPIVGRAIRDGGHGELSESRRTSGPAGRRWSE